MSTNYAREIPHDKGGEGMNDYYPAYKANIRYGTNNATISSVITLNDNTTIVEVAAVGSPVLVRWIPASETASVSPFASVIGTGANANFDHTVAKDTVKQFVIPIETQGTSSIVGIGVQAGTYRRVAISSGGAVSSILVAEF